MFEVLKILLVLCVQIFVVLVNIFVLILVFVVLVVFVVVVLIEVDICVCIFVEEFGCCSVIIVVFGVFFIGYVELFVICLNDMNIIVDQVCEKLLVVIGVDIQLVVVLSVGVYIYVGNGNLVGDLVCVSVLVCIGCGECQVDNVYNGMMFCELVCVLLVDCGIGVVLFNVL